MVNLANIVYTAHSMVCLAGSNSMVSGIYDAMELGTTRGDGVKAWLCTLILLALMVFPGR